MHLSAAEPACTLEWKKITPSPFSRTEAATAVVDGKLYLFGGFIERLETSNEVNVYDLATDKWTRKSVMPTRPTHVNAAVDVQFVWLAGPLGAALPPGCHCLREPAGRWPPDVGFFQFG